MRRLIRFYALTGLAGAALFLAFRQGPGVPEAAQADAAQEIAIESGAWDSSGLPLEAPALAPAGAVSGLAAAGAPAPIAAFPQPLRASRRPPSTRAPPQAVPTA